MFEHRVILHRVMRICSLAAVASMIETPIAVFPPAVLAASPPIFVVRLAVTGGYHFAGTLSATAQQSGGYFCQALAAARQYTADYDLDAIVKVGNGDVSKDAFQLGIETYSPRVRMYRHGIIVSLVIRHHGYEDSVRGRNNATYQAWAQLAADRHSGHFWAHHLLPLRGHGGPVDVQGSWRCTKLST